LRLTLPAALAAALAALAFVPDAAAQCALCRTALEGAGAATARTMNLAILVLLIPPVAIFCAIFAALRRGDGKGERDGQR
jgi:hypothetical protein